MRSKHNSVCTIRFASKHYNFIVSAEAAAATAVASPLTTAINDVESKCYGCLGKFAKANTQRRTRRTKKDNTFYGHILACIRAHRVMTSSMRCCGCYSRLWSWQWGFTQMIVSSVHFIGFTCMLISVLSSFLLIIIDSIAIICFALRGIWMRSMILQFIK